MIRISEKSAFLLVIFAIACACVIDMVGLNPDARLVPMIVAVSLIVLSGFAAVLELSPSRNKVWRPSSANNKKPARDLTLEREKGRDGDLAARYLFFAWMLVFVGSIYFLGVLWATGIAMFIWLRWSVRATWMNSLVYAVGAVAFIYLVFVVGFHYSFFMRPVFPWWRYGIHFG